MSIRYTERLLEAGIEPSVGSVGDSYDNALAETVIGLFKTEVIHRRGPWRSLEAVEYASRKSRMRALVESHRSAEAAVSSLGIEKIRVDAGEAAVAQAREICAFARARIADVRAVARYREALRRLTQARSLEEIARQQAGLQDRIAKNSLQLWQLWLRLQPSRMPPAQRQRLGRYSAVLKMVIEAGTDGELSQSARAEYRSLLREVAPLLPCWAVTSLSARGRIEFDPGSFDIVVFDEASQCDIASALPLLYRAKSVVVIGDAKQLSLGVISGDDVEARLAAIGPEYPAVARPELVSDWERVFYSALFAAGIRPVPQYPVEKYVLDFLVVAGDRRLAIEVDGERYHRNWTGELCRRDQIRNQRLFELGYDVRRFWVYEIRDDLQRCVRDVEEWLRKRS